MLNWFANAGLAMPVCKCSGKLLTQCCKLDQAETFDTKFIQSMFFVSSFWLSFLSNSDSTTFNLLKFLYFHRRRASSFITFVYFRISMTPHKID